MLVYKYRGGDEEIFKRDIASLEKDCFWASNIESLNDPCEALVDGEYFKPYLERAASILTGSSYEVATFKEVYGSLKELISKVLKAGIFSLSKRYDDELLWAHYANSHKGFCIEYDLDILTRRKNREFNRIDVLYAKKPPRIEVKDIIHLNKNGITSFLQKLAGTKSKLWSYEQEVRIVTDTFGSQSYDFRAVKGIYFGLKMPESQKEAVMNRLKGRGIKYYQIYLKEKSYQFDANPVLDKYENSPPYLYKIAPIAESASAIEKSWIEEFLKPYIPYKRKAVEIARRDPYCAKVLWADFHSSSTPEKPIVFVQSIGIHQNYYDDQYSLKEIDKLYANIQDLE